MKYTNPRARTFEHPRHSVRFPTEAQPIHGETGLWPLSSRQATRVSDCRLSIHVRRYLPENERTQLAVVARPVATPARYWRQELKVSQGAYVSQVSGGGPADTAGVEAGDVITRFGTTDVRDEVGLRNAIATTKPGSQVAIQVRREGKPLTLNATLEELKELRPAPATRSTATKKTPEVLEATLEPLDAEARIELKLEESVKGLLVTAVKQGTPTDEAGLVRGMVLQSVNGKLVTTLEEAKKAASTVRSGGLVMLKVLLPSRTGKPSRAAINISVP